MNNAISCIICSRKFKGQRGISIHVLQHSKACFNGYVEKYGSDRTKWPKETFLRIKTCNDCGSLLKDPRSMKYCSRCRALYHNVMKKPNIVKKQQITMKPIFESEEYRNKLSKKAKARFKNNPELKEVQREYMLNGGASHARQFITSPSKPQLKLFNLVQQVAPYPIIEYPYLNKSIDIAIPILSIAIEYDGMYWHDDIEHDRNRQKILEDDGWIFIRYIDNIPSKEELIDDINKCLKGL